MALKLKGSTSGFVAIDCAAEGGNNTLILPSDNGVAGAIWANNVDTAGVATCTSITINKNGDLTVPGTVSIGGTLTYEDVTNVDVVGVVTAAQGVRINGGGLSIIGITTGLSVSGVGTFAGDVSIADKIIHTGDTNTAIRFPAADTITAETAGSERLRIASTGDLGLNVTPASWSDTFVALEGGGTSKHGALHFQANGDWTTSLGCNNYYNSGWKYRHAGGASWFEMKEDTFKFSIASSGSADGAITWSEKMRIDSAGNVGIGEDVPASRLHLANTGSGNVSMTITNDTTGHSAGNGLEIGIGGDEQAQLWNYENTYFRLATNNAERLRVTASGNVGIGTDSPENDLHIVKDSATLKLTSTDSATSSRLILESEADSYGGIHFGDPSDEDSGRIRYYHGGSNPDHMQFSTAATERVRITSAGLVGIGISAPTEKLHVIGQVGGNNPTAGSKWEIARFVAHDYSPTNSGGLTIGAYWNNSVVSERTSFIQSSQGTDSGSTTRALLLNPDGGNIGIGTDDPDNRLHIWGDSPLIKAELHPSNTGTDQDCFRAVAGPTGNSVFNIRAKDASSDNSAWILKTNSSEHIIFNIGGNELLKIEATGDVGIGTDNPNNRLHLLDSSNSILFVESADTDADIIQADTGGSTRIRSSSGNITMFTGGDAQSSSAANASSAGVFSAGRFAVGMTPVATDSSSNFSAGLIQTDGNIDLRFAGTNVTGGARHVCFVNTDTTLVDGQPMGGLNWVGNDTSNPSQLMAQIVAICGGNAGAGNHIRISTSGTERVKIHDNGTFGVGTSNESTYNDDGDGSSGLTMNGPNKYTSCARWQGTPFFVNRMSSDGTLIWLGESGSKVGEISVSGNTVSYEAFLGSHKGRLSDGSKSTILPGTIIENINQTIEWKTATISNVGSASSTVVIPYYGAKTSGTDTVSYGGASYTGTVGISSNYQPKGDNKHVCVKVSDTASSKAVAGVFVSWNDNINDAKDNGLDEPYNDLSVGGVGNFFIRMKSGETIANGDLVESNGDGTGKVQSDDIIRSKTVGKITNTNVIKTYSDGSFLVTAVLYAG